MSYVWNFGNTNASSLTISNPVDTFKTANGSSVPVTLTVTSSIGGCATSLTKNIVVNAPYVPTTPVSKFVLNGVLDTQCIANNNYVFTNNSATGSDISYKWSFGDTSSVSYTTATPPAHKYAAVGVYTVSLTVTNNLGVAQTSTLAVTVDAAPVTSFTASTSTAGTVNANIINFNSTSTLAAGNMSYVWNFNGGNSSSTTISNPVDTFNSSLLSSSGTSVNVTLTVTSSIGGCTSFATKAITVFPGYVPTTPSPSLSLYYVADTQCVNGNSYTFNYGKMNADVTPVIDFGDGTPTYTGTQFGQIVSHTYSKAGVYTVKLTESNQLGVSKTVTLAVTLAASPVASFIYQANQGGEGDSLFFNSTSTVTAGNMTYAWNFGDASDPGTVNTSTLSNPYHRFYKASYPYNLSNPYTAYSVTLTVTNSIGGCTASADSLINVYPGDEGYSVVNRNTIEAEVALSSKVNVYPNPAVSVIKASFVPTTSKVILKVVDLYGRVVKVVPQSTIVGTTNIAELDINSLNSGSYILTILNELGVKISSTQFVKAAK